MLRLMETFSLKTLNVGSANNYNPHLLDRWGFLIYNIIMDKYIDQFLQIYYPCMNLQGMSVVDFGCGLGSNSIELASRGAIVFSIDKSLNNLQAVEKLANEKNLNIFLKQQNLINYRCVKKYDIVLFNFVLHFIKEELQLNVVQNIIDSVKSGGILIFSDLEDIKKISPDVLNILQNNLINIKIQKFKHKDSPHPGMNFPHWHKGLYLAGVKK